MRTKDDMELELQTAALGFLRDLAPDLQAYTSSSKQPEYNIRSLVFAAFRLYQHEWSPADIREWRWPVTVLRDGTGFNGDEPWSVLLQRAVDLNARRIFQ